MIEVTRIGDVISAVNEFRVNLPLTAGPVINGGGNEKGLTLLPERDVLESNTEDISVTIGTPDNKGYFNLQCQIRKLVYKEPGSDKKTETKILNIAGSDIVATLDAFSKISKVAAAMMPSLLIACITNDQIVAQSGKVNTVGPLLASLTLGDTAIDQDTHKKLKEFAEDFINKRAGNSLNVANTVSQNYSKMKSEFELKSKLPIMVFNNMAMVMEVLRDEIQKSPTPIANIGLNLRTTEASPQHVENKDVLPRALETEVLHGNTSVLGIFDKINK